MTHSCSQLLINAQQGETEERHPDSDFLLAFAKGNYIEAERFLLSRLSQEEGQEIQADRLWWLCQVYKQQLIPQRKERLVRRIAICVPANDHRLHQLSLQYSRLRGDSVSTGPYSASLKELTHGIFPHLDLEIASALLRQGQLSLAEVALKQSGAIPSCEATMLQARLLRLKGQQEAAESLLITEWARHKHRLDYCIQLIEILFELRRGDACLPALKNAVAEHGCYASPLLERFCQARMLQRQPGVALRLKVLERLPKLSGAIVAQPTILGAIYDSLGRSDWLSFLSIEIENKIDHCPELHSNRLMHLSSRASAFYPETCKKVVKLIAQSIEQQVNPFKRKIQIDAMPKLRVGWICADIANHPVGRFLLSWLEAAQEQLAHEHIVVGIAPSDMRYAQLFCNLPHVQFLDHSAPAALSVRIERLRQLNLDIAIDLNGWTGNHIAPAFIARIAPLQLNYLAYHASSGIPAMDAWVVDHELLPAVPNCEWHSEQLLRLDRPFLAWQPHPALPEAAAAVTQPDFAPTSGIRFGCFNHLRKISDEALQCWARILSALPTARMVLKAHSADDNATATLLQRRLERSGLPLQQVIWLPYTATPDDHLQQYGQMDVALDSFPNTGCTTTCEALWMGVPVITLQGSHYVSRMAAAVLHGTGLQEWICDSTSAYEKLAIEQAEPQRLAWLRENRHHWRRQLQQSPLGDARDLMQQLESAFTTLAERQLAEQGLQLTANPPGLVQR